MENQNNIQLNSSPKNLKKLLIPVVFLVLIVVVILGFLLLKDKKSNDQAFIDDKEKEQIQRTSIPGSTEFEKDGVSFSFPSDYETNELEKGYYVVFKEGESIPSEAGINIDARRQDANSNFDEAVKTGRNNLLEPKEKQIPEGVKMYGTIKEGIGKGIPTLYVYLKYDKGAIRVEHSGEILNEAVFDQIVNSIKIN